MLRLHNGSIIFANPASKHNRTAGTLRRSDDDAKTWSHVHHVTDNETWYAYSSLTEVDFPDEVGLLWETGDTRCTGPSCKIVFSKIKVFESSTENTKNFSCSLKTLMSFIVKRLVQIFSKWLL